MPRRFVRCASALRIAAAALCVAPGLLRGQPADAAPTFVPLATVSADDSLPPPIEREFRGVWIATVDNIDWPSRPGLSPDSQRLELRALLDRAAALHLNAVIFQVRPSADALYRSKLEPWSYFLTGRQGIGPQPEYDPLEYAITEAHRRGLELHAWFNPYRARHPAEKARASARHVSRARPGLVRKYGPYLWMDPGEPWVRAHTTRVILDVVKRYDVDGIHIDDYFYPYPERTRRGREIPFPDAASWKKYRARKGTLSRDAWRRDNVDRLVDTLYREIKRAKPWVKFGISPFGIWKPGHPDPVRGLDAYEKLYADSRRWLNEGWIDYFTPQLYWKVSAPAQAYGELLAWWRGENRQNRHVWPGNYTSRVSGDGGSTWGASEILEQVRLTRESATSAGNVHFSMSAFVKDADALGERLTAGPYAQPALVPASTWLSAETPDAPEVTLTSANGVPHVTIVPRRAAPVRPAPPGQRGVPRERPPVLPPSAGARAIRWWTVRVAVDGEWLLAIVDGRRREFDLPAPATGRLPQRVVVTAVDMVGNESAPMTIATVP